MKQITARWMSKPKGAKPVVSVLIPVFNGAQYLEESVKSVLKSTKLPIEIILVDDGSSDGSKQLCRNLAKKYRAVQYFDFAVNQGMTRCLNTGITHARGEYIARINQDDLMQKNRLEKQVTFLEKHPDHVVVGGFVELFTAENAHYDNIEFPTTDEDIKRLWMTLSPFADPTVMYRKSAYLKTKGYDQTMWPADDVHMWYQLGSIGKLANIPQVLTRVRWHAAAGSVKSHRLQMRNTFKVHLWAAEHIRKPTIYEQLFWSGQYIAGTFFTAQFNWGVYRILRHMLKTFSIITDSAKQGIEILSGFVRSVFSPKIVAYAKQSYRPTK